MTRLALIMLALGFQSTSVVAQLKMPEFPAYDTAQTCSNLLSSSIEVVRATSKDCVNVETVYKDVGLGIWSNKDSWGQEISSVHDKCRDVASIGGGELSYFTALFSR